MPLPPVIPLIRTALEAYLDARMAEWKAQPDDRRQPTLPFTNDGKINVRGLAVELARLNPERSVSDAQHFYKDELRTLVNAAAEAQGLALIGSRMRSDALDAAIGKRIDKSASKLSDLQKVCSEQAASIELLRRRVVSLEEMLKIRDQTGMTFRCSI